MTKRKEKLISIPSLCELYGKDPSQLRKMIDKLSIPKIKVKRESDNKVVTAIYDSDHQKIVDEYPNLTAPAATKSHVSFSEACDKLGYGVKQMSNFKRLCTRMNIEIMERKFKGRTQKCILKKEYTKLKKLADALTIADV